MKDRNIYFYNILPKVREIFGKVEGGKQGVII